MELKAHIDQSDALKEAQEIIIRCGAISYCADQLIQRYEKARVSPGKLPLAKHEPITCLFEEVIAPVQKLLQASES